MSLFDLASAAPANCERPEADKPTAQKLEAAVDESGHIRIWSSLSITRIGGHKAVCSTHNQLGFMSDKSETYLYPFFPYIPEDQMDIQGPNYKELAIQFCTMAHEEDLINGFRIQNEGRHEVFYIHFMDGESVRLSDMQAMLMMKGFLKGYKRLREKELGIRPLHEKKFPIHKKLDYSGSATVALQDRFEDTGKPKKKRKSRKKKKKSSKALPKEAQKQLEELKASILNTAQDDSWLDDVF